MKFKNCLKCGKKVSKNCHLGYCNRCRDRSGKNNPFYGKKHKKETIERTRKKLSIITKKLWQDPKYSTRHSKMLKKLWQNSTYREKVIKGTSKPRRESFKKEQSERVKQWYKNNPIQREIRSKQMKESWRLGKIEPNINSINESKIEKEFRAKLKRKLPSRKVRKSTIRIKNKWFYPDVRIDKNIIIEFYGNYWHANPLTYKSNEIVHHNFTAKQIWNNDKERIKILENNGFRVFIVWQDEYQNNKNKIINNIIKQL